MNRLPTILEPEEAVRLIKQPDKRYITGLRNKAMLSVMLNMGLRLNEVVNLKPGDINLTKGKLKVVQGKGSKDRLLGIPEATVYLLGQWRNVRPRSDYFFSTIKGTKIMDRYVQNMVHRYAQKAGIEKSVYPHALRHTYATEYYRRTRDIETLKRILGHSSISTTTIYINLANVEVENGMKGFREFT